MATVSQTATPLTSPGYMWEDALATEPEAPHHGEQRMEQEDPRISERPPLASQNGNFIMRNNTGLDDFLPRESDGDLGTDLGAKGLERSFFPPSDQNEPKPRSVKDLAKSESLLEPHRAINGDRPVETRKRGPGGLPPDSDSDDNSKWIHRDKLARIESQELQAAGIFLPRQRDRARSKSQNRPRRDQSQDKANGSGGSIGGSEQTVTRSRKNSATTDPRAVDATVVPSWDLRRPEEILEEGDGHWVIAGNGKGSSRIPVAKTSPVPIPSEHLARDTRLARKRDGSPNAEDSITFPKQRGRSGSTGNALAKTAGAGQASQPIKRTDSSPKKPAATATARKPKPANGAAGRPKTRGGPSRDSTSSGTGTTRPSTRSGEREFSSSNSKPMEGEPPWMVSAYRPDPRLPPDQQLLPTVAKRLQQEKWEREGKFGSIYDKEFRPLTDEGFLKPPGPGSPADQENENENEKGDHKNDQGEWPLKAEPKSPSLPGRLSSYSTMPKITDTPVANALPSPRAPSRQAQQGQTVRLPDDPEDSAQKKEGCGCCIVM